MLERTILSLQYLSYSVCVCWMCVAWVEVAMGGQVGPGVCGGVSAWVLMH